MEATISLRAKAKPNFCWTTFADQKPSVAAIMSDTIAEDHLMGAWVGNASGPTLIVIGGLHGNEPAGATALSQLSQELAEISYKLKGRVYFLAGNMAALEQKVRFIDEDLNRCWTPHHMSNVGTPKTLASSEGRELTQLDRLLDSILITAMDEVFVLDLHSTSADGVPFATVGDTLRNREFAKKFPVTILLGIEEQLEGTMLEYLNNAGAVTLGFEGGHHLSDNTVENHSAMVWLALTNSGVLPAGDNPAINRSTRRLANGHETMRLIEMRYRHAITADDGFEMAPGFNNFDKVRSGDTLGKDRNGSVTSPETGLILMPLYQPLGNDGFFIGREISPFWLWLSGIIRNLGVQNIIHILPGVSRDPLDPATLTVNTRWARLAPMQVFHLLGFRRLRWVNNELVVSRRTHDTSGPFRWKGNQ